MEHSERRILLKIKDWLKDNFFRPVEFVPRETYETLWGRFSWNGQKVRVMVFEPINKDRLPSISIAQYHWAMKQLKTNVLVWEEDYKVAITEGKDIRYIIEPTKKEQTTNG